MALKDEDKEEITGIVTEALKRDRAANAPKAREGNEERRKTDRRKPVEPRREPTFLESIVGGGS